MGDGGRLPSTGGDLLWRQEGRRDGRHDGWATKEKSHDTTTDGSFEFLKLTRVSRTSHRDLTLISLQVIFANRGIVVGRVKLVPLRFASYFYCTSQPWTNGNLGFARTGSIFSRRRCCSMTIAAVVSSLHAFHLQTVC